MQDSVLKSHGFQLRILLCLATWGGGEAVNIPCAPRGILLASFLSVVRFGLQMKMPTTGGNVVRVA